MENGTCWIAAICRPEYAITKNGATVASIQREFLTLGSRYALEVADPQDALLAICVVLAIDCCDEEHSG